MKTNMITEPTLEELTAAKLAGLTLTCLWCNGHGLELVVEEDKTGTGWKKLPAVTCTRCCGRGWVIHRPVDGGTRQ
jgi:hypothetical protein